MSNLVSTQGFHVWFPRRDFSISPSLRMEPEMAEETKLQRHRAKQKKAGITRFSVQLDAEALSLLRRLCLEHSQTQGDLLGMAIKTADALFTGRLQIANSAAQPTPRVIIRAEPQERPQAEDQAAGN